MMVEKERALMFRQRFSNRAMMSSNRQILHKSPILAACNKRLGRPSSIHAHGGFY